MGAARRLAEVWKQPPELSTIQLHGRQTSDLLAVAAAAAQRLGRTAIRIRASDLAGPVHEREFLARLVERDAPLNGLAIALEVDGVVPGTAPLAQELHPYSHQPTSDGERRVDLLHYALPRPG